MQPRHVGFVPPYVIDALMHCGVADVRGAALVTEEQSSRTRIRRAGVARGPDAAGRIPAPEPHGARTVYDCGGTFSQRVGDPIRAEGGPATGDRDADDGYDYAGAVREYFRTEHARDSVDGAGFPLVLNVHYGVRYMNAFWDGDEMTFGDGDGRVFVGFARSLDVVAHELGHGVTQFETGLVYRGQSGALNEHYSDVWGAAITQFTEGVDAGEADWLIGNEVLAPGLEGQALRSMKAPGTAYDNPLMGTDPQPAHMRDYYAGPGDNQGVHINSGIPNRAFYLTAMAIGTDRAAAIWYAAQPSLTANATFNDAVAALIAAARARAEVGDAPREAAESVRRAFGDVGLPA
jgi:Zn-dependent metalloprotease